MKRKTFGLALTVIGVLALLQVMGLHFFGLTFWSSVFLLAGVSILTGSLFNRWKPSIVGAAFGLWLGAIGLFDILFANQLVPITGSELGRSGWPLIVIAIGLALVFGRRGWHHAWHGKHPAWKGGGSMGDLHFGSGPWKLERDLAVNHGMGDLKVDLTTAEITPGEHQITVSVGMGELLLRVPANMSLHVKANAGLGEVAVLGEKRSGVGARFEADYPVADAQHTLHIDASVGMGSLRIVQGAPPTARILA
jgi:lia operon protein LiaF